MRVVGIQLVRDEVDILRANLRYNLSLGLDELLVLDNGSIDGSTEVLRDVAAQAPVTWWSESTPYNHGGLLTRLAEEAHRRGADWVLPIDVDEFWYVPEGDVRAVLAATGAAALRVRVQNFVQCRADVPEGPEALLSMTFRAEPGVPSHAENERATEEGRIAYVEIDQRPKTALRVGDGLQVSDGSHTPVGLSGEVEDSEDIVVLHAPLRRPSILDAKAERGGRIIERGFEPGSHWHERRWYRLRQERGNLEEEWAANSQHNGALDVGDARHPVQPDERLRAAVEPWIDQQGTTERSIRQLDQHAVLTGELVRSWRETRELRTRAVRAEAHLEEVLNTKTFRYTEALRKAYGRLIRRR